MLSQTASVWVQVDTQGKYLNTKDTLSSLGVYHLARMVISPLHYLQVGSAMFNSASLRRNWTKPQLMSATISEPRGRAHTRTGSCLGSYIT